MTVHFMSLRRLLYKKKCTPHYLPFEMPSTGRFWSTLSQSVISLSLILINKKDRRFWMILNSSKESLLTDMMWAISIRNLCSEKITPWFTLLLLTLKVMNFWKFTSYCSLKPLWSGMGEVVLACTSLTLHPPSLPTVLQLLRLAL